MELAADSSELGRCDSAGPVAEPPDGARDTDTPGAAPAPAALAAAAAAAAAAAVREDTEESEERRLPGRPKVLLLRRAAAPGALAPGEALSSLPTVPTVLPEPCLRMATATAVAGAVFGAGAGELMASCPRPRVSAPSTSPPSSPTSSWSSLSAPAMRRSVCRCHRASAPATAATCAASGPAVSATVRAAAVRSVSAVPDSVATSRRQ